MESSSPLETHLGPLEMQVMGLVEPEESRSVNWIQARLAAQGRDLAYTTVMTVVSRLHKKGVLTRHKEGRQFVYSRNRQTGDVSQSILEKVGRALFRQTRLKPILALLSSEDELTTDELRELRRAVDERLKKSKR